MVGPSKTDQPFTHRTGRAVDFIGSMNLGLDNDDNQHEGWCVMISVPF